MMLFRFFTAVLLCVALIQPAQAAEGGKLREMLQQRMQERSAGGEEGAGAGGGKLGALLAKRKAGGSDDGSGMMGNLSCEKMHKLVGGKTKKHDSDDVAPTMADLAYGAAEAQKLDVYIPSGAKNAPIIFMVHGGGWCIGDKSMGKVATNKVARWLPKGFIFVSVNYRMVPDGADVPTQANDVAKALAYTQEHASEWGGNADKVILMGHSAGAHLVSLIGSDVAIAKDNGARPWLGAVSLDSAVMNVPQMMVAKPPAFYTDAFGTDVSFWPTVSPFHLLSKESLPWLGVCSSQRKDACPQAHAFSRQAEKFGVTAGVLEQELSHGEINGQLGEAGAYTDAVEQFMASLDGEVAALLR